MRGDEVEHGGRGHGGCAWMVGPVPVPCKRQYTQCVQTRAGEAVVSMPFPRRTSHHSVRPCWPAHRMLSLLKLWQGFEVNLASINGSLQNVGDVQVSAWRALANAGVVWSSAPRWCPFRTRHSRNAGPESRTGRQYRTHSPGLTPTLPLSVPLSGLPLPFALGGDRR